MTQLAPPWTIIERDKHREYVHWGVVLFDMKNIIILQTTSVAQKSDTRYSLWKRITKPRYPHAIRTKMLYKMFDTKNIKFMIAGIYRGWPAPHWLWLAVTDCKGVIRFIVTSKPHVRKSWKSWTWPNLRYFLKCPIKLGWFWKFRFSLIMILVKSLDPAVFAGWGSKLNYSLDWLAIEIFLSWAAVRVLRVASTPRSVL